MIYSTIVRSFLLVLALLLAIPTLASAQDWAQTVLFPGTKIAMNGVVKDSEFGTFPVSNQIIITSATNFTDGEEEGNTGSYTYVKLSPTTAQLSYAFTYWEDGEGITESGVISLNYTSHGSGSYSISSSYIFYLIEGSYSGSYTEKGSFSHIIAPAPLPPVISEISDLSTSENTAVTVPFTISNPAPEVGPLTFSVVSSNTELVPQSNISVSGSGSSRTVTLLPLANQWGTTTITIVVSNGFSHSSATFVLTVAAEDRAPVISGLSNATTETGMRIEIPFAISDANGPAESLTLEITSILPAVLPRENIALSGTGGNRTLTITPTPDVTGMALIRVSVSDGALSDSKIVILTITRQTLAGWRQVHFNSRIDAGDGADLHDFDHDGMVNLMEFALGTLPNDPSSVAQPVISMEGNGRLALTVNKPADRQEITYRAEFSTNLVDWDKSPDVISLASSSATSLRFVESAGPSDKRFMRLVVTSP